MDVEKIDNLHEVLNENLGANRKIIDYKISRLTAPGENYGSLMLRLDLQVQDEKTNREETVHTVAKLLPPNELLQQMFNVQVTFTKEIAIYKNIIPVLEDFGKEQGVSKPIDFIPKYYGARISMDPKSTTVDMDAILILENLKISGYVTAERTLGFDLDEAKLILTHLAHFHVAPIALKLKSPNQFEKLVKPHLPNFDITNDHLQPMTNRVFPIIQENEKCLPHLARVRELMKQGSVKNVREPFATIMHHDLWVNNIMLKYDQKKPVGCKILDFQLIEYKSFAKDLIFFLFLSVQQKVLEWHLDSLLDFYYNTFIENLKEYKCDCNLFSREAFDRELDLAAKESEFFHVVFMTFPIFAKSENIKELDQYTVEDFSHDHPVTQAQKEKIWYVTLEFVKRGWLY